MSSMPGLRAAIGLMVALVVSTGMDARAADVWSTLVGTTGCERTASDADRIALTIPAGPLPSCGVGIADPKAFAGHPVALTASFEAAGANVPTVSLMLTQFQGGRIVAHQFVSSPVAAGVVAPLVLRTYAFAESDSLVVSLQAVDATTTITVRDLALTASPPMDEGAMSDSARTYLDHALDLIASHSILLEPARRASLLRESRALATGATRPSETYEAIRHALAQIGDGHSRFFDPSTADALRSLAPDPPYGITRASIDASLGYLAVPEFGAVDTTSRTRFADFLDFSLRGVLTSKTIDGLVIDLRSDGGGSLDAMIDGLCVLFPARSTLIGFADRTSKRFDMGCKQSRPIDARTRALAREMPVAVLVGPTTASAGEMLAVALKNRHRTILIGSPTRGLTTDIHVVPMRDGAMLLLAIAILVDRAGQRYPHGVDPEIVVPPQAAATHDRSDPAIMRARDWIAASIRAHGGPQ